MKTFNDLSLSAKMLDTLAERNFNTPTEIQVQAIPLLKQNKDLIGLSQTGTGKTFAFLIPLIEKIEPDNNNLQALILCPTRELCLQITKEAKMLDQNFKHIRVVAVYGGADINGQIFALKRKANIIVGTPGRVLDHIRRHTIKLLNINTVVLDEADEMLNMGFRKDIETILAKTPESRQTVCFSATMNDEIMGLIKTHMKEPEQIKIGKTNTALSNIEQTYFVVPKDKKKKALHSLLCEIPEGKTLIFCNTKKMVGGVQSYLEKMGYQVSVLHGDMPQSLRTKIMREYKDNISNLLITTDVSARGIDVNNIAYVINYDLPANLEYYIHRIGRTGRAGKKGCAYTILNSEEQAEKLKEICKKTQSTITLKRLQLNNIDELKVAKNLQKTSKNKTQLQKSRFNNKTKSFKNKNVKYNRSTKVSNQNKKMKYKK